MLPPPAAGDKDGPLSSEGTVDPHSNDFWAQSDLTLKNAEQLTSLTVQLKVAQTGGVSSTGAWRALPEQDFDLTVGEQDGFLVYTWVLKAGRTVPKGEWVFAGAVQPQERRPGHQERQLHDQGHGRQGAALGGRRLRGARGRRE